MISLPGSVSYKSVKYNALIVVSIEALRSLLCRLNRPPLGASQRLTKLALTPTNNTAFYIYDWLVGLGEIIIQNEGYSASSEMTAQQREQLAAISMLFQAD